jgi:hypothetical protein
MSDYDSDDNIFEGLDDLDSFGQGASAFDQEDQGALAFGQGESAFWQTATFDQQAPAFGQGAAFDDSREARKRRVSQAAQANRNAASPEQHELAIKLRSFPIPPIDHKHISSQSRNNCRKCANIINDLYQQHGSTIDFAMIDPRWPYFICKHLKSSFICKE